MTIFVDMDGVLADFDTHHLDVFGAVASKELDNVDWKEVRKVEGFYLNMPPMPDMQQLWAHVRRYKPIVLTGVPRLVEEAPHNKRAWVAKHLGTDVEVRTCRSKDKSLHCTGPRDILIDDWPKYRDLWMQKGGVWITHTSAVDTIAQLRRMGIN